MKVGIVNEDGSQWTEQELDCYMDKIVKEGQAALEGQAKPDMSFLEQEVSESSEVEKEENKPIFLISEPESKLVH